MSNHKQEHQRRRQIVVLGISLARGITAVVLGAILIFNPNRSQVFLMNLMGFFWLTSGIALIRPSKNEVAYGKRTSLIMGLVGIVTGLLVVTRQVTRQWVPEIAVVELLGAAILLTGVLHMLGQFRIGGLIRRKQIGRRRSILSFLLGFLEIILGLLLIWSPLAYGPVAYWTATIWSLIFGGLVIGDALIQRFGKPEVTEVSTQPDRPKTAPEINKASKQ